MRALLADDPSSTLTAMSDNSPLTESGSRRPFFFRAALVGLTICIVLCSGVLFWYLASHRKHRAALDAIVARIRASGDPLDGAELDAFYAIPKDEPDLTAEYMAAIGMIGNLTLTAEQQTLPFVGSAEAPEVGELWETLPIAEDFLKPLAPQLDALRELGRRPGRVRYPIRLADGLGAQLPEVQRLRDAARRLMLEFYVRLHRDDRTGALDSLRALIRLGETLADEPVLVSQLVRCALVGMSVKSAEAFLSGGRATDEELQTLRDTLSGLDFLRGLRRSLRGERATAYHTLQSELTIQQVTGGDSGSLPNVSLKTVSNLRPGDTARLLELHSEMIEATDRPLPEALQRLKAISDDLRQMTTNERGALPWNRHVFAPLLIPAVESAAQAFGRVTAQRDALLAAIAIERYRLKHSALPARLDDLVPDFLAAVPGDPFTGGPLSFVADEQGYTVYSHGPDRVDQGGLVIAPGKQPPDLGVRIQNATGKPR